MFPLSSIDTAFLPQLVSVASMLTIINVLAYARYESSANYKVNT